MFVFIEITAHKKKFQSQKYLYTNIRGTGATNENVELHLFPKEW